MTEKRQKAFENELEYIQSCERDLQKQAMRVDIPWKKAFEKKIPSNVHKSLKAAFAAAFRIIFENGVTVIEKTFNKGRTDA